MTESPGIGGGVAVADGGGVGSLVGVLAGALVGVGLDVLGEADGDGVDGPEIGVAVLAAVRLGAGVATVRVAVAAIGVGLAVPPVWATDKVVCPSTIPVDRSVACRLRSPGAPGVIANVAKPSAPVRSGGPISSAARPPVTPTSRSASGCPLPLRTAATR